MTKYFIKVGSKSFYKVLVANLENLGYVWSSGKGLRDYTPPPEEGLILCLRVDKKRVTWTNWGGERYLTEEGFKDGTHLFPLVLEDNT